MINFIKKAVSLFLTLALILCIVPPAFAAETSSITNDSECAISYYDIEMARNTYNSLSGEAKVIFDSALLSDPEMMDFHIAYVDSNYVIDMPKDQPSLATMAVATADPMTILTTQLAALSLPTAVTYSLKALGASMVAAVADGPLPIGDILLAAATVGTAAVIAANWNEIAPKWNGIVNAFTTAFSNSVSNVVSAFKTILGNVNSKLEDEPNITVSGKTITINGTKYHCNVKADVLTAKQTQNKKYFPAVLYNSSVFVCPTAIDTKIAKAIMILNNKTIGVWATSEKYARGVCGSNPVWHNTHKSTEGYFFHYHMAGPSKSHCWYLG